MSLMTPLEQLQSMLSEKYKTEDGETYKIEPKKGLTEDEITRLTKASPAGYIPEDIKALLRFSKGFDLLFPEEITFDGIGHFGLESVFPHSVQLAPDGSGNFWVLDVDSKGNWGAVFYVCHDPGAVVKHSDNLAEFLLHIDEDLKKPEQSHFNRIYNKTVYEVSASNNGFTEAVTAKQGTDPVLKAFAADLPDNFLIADLRNAPLGSGFDMRRFHANIEHAVRYHDEYLWAIEPRAKKGFFARFFGK